MKKTLCAYSVFLGVLLLSAPALAEEPAAAPAPQSTVDGPPAPTDAEKLVQCLAVVRQVAAMDVERATADLARAAQLNKIAGGTPQQ